MKSDLTGYTESNLSKKKNVSIKHRLGEPDPIMIFFYPPITLKGKKEGKMQEKEEKKKETKERATPVSRYTAVRARRVEFDGKTSSDCCYSFLVFIIKIIFRII